MYRSGGASGAAFLVVLIATPAEATPARIDIPAQSATSGLLALSRQANVQILSARRNIRSKWTNGVKGVMEPQSALSQMLTGTGLHAERMNDRTFVVMPAPSIAPPDKSIATSSATTPKDSTEPPSPGLASTEAIPQPEIVVTGIRSSLKSALRLKRNTDVVSDGISSDEIGQLPDVTIAEELNRLPGVNTIRDRGNASQASLRGLGPRFVLGLVNGREVASSEPSQELRWEVYPSEILSAVQVYKTQDASFIPGGIAATVDIRTMKPLDYYGRTVTVRFGPTYDEEANDLPDYSPWGYRGSAGIITHLSNTFAIALAASIQKEKNGFPDFRTWGWNTPDSSGGHTGDLNGDGSPDNTSWGLNTELKNVVQDRYAFVANAGWAPSDALTVNFDTLYSRYTIGEHQFQTAYGNNILGNSDNADAAIFNGPGATYQVVHRSVIAAHLPDSYPNYQSVIADYREAHDLFVSGANIEWNSGPWAFSADLSHSQANRFDRWRGINLATQYGRDLDYDLSGLPSASVTGQAIDPWNPSIQTVDPNRTGTVTGPEYTKDRISAVALNGQHQFVSSFLKSFEFGARIADRVKTHRFFNYALCAGSTTSGSCDWNAHTVDLSSLLSDYDPIGFIAPPVVIGDFNRIFSLTYPASNVPAGAEQLLQRSRVELKTAEAYSKLGFGLTIGALPVTGSFGIRLGRTDTRSSGFQQDSAGAISPVTVSNSYTDVLPSLNATASLTRKQLLRFGASIGISRPPLDALVTGYVLNSILPGQQPVGTGGNPKLRPFKAAQLDLSYENYFHDESLFALAAFYKHVTNYIGGGTALQTIDGTSYLISTLANGNGGNVWGLESRFQTRFYFLPGILRNFGVYANYAYTSSNIHEFAPAGDPYRMIGLAKHTAEFDTYYSKGPFEVRLGVKYHSPFAVTPTWVGTSLKELAAETLVDASASWQITSRLGVRVQARNLTNERARFTSDNNVQNLAADMGYQLYGRSYLMDLSLSL